MVKPVLHALKDGRERNIEEAAGVSYVRELSRTFSTYCAKESGEVEKLTFGRDGRAPEREVVNCKAEESS